MKGLDGKTAIETGAGSGIGRASAERFADEGAAVLVADVVEEGGRETVELIEEAGGDATFVNVDVADVDSVGRMIDATVDTYGSLDFAHNNAGILTSIDTHYTVVCIHTPWIPQSKKSNFSPGRPTESV